MSNEGFVTELLNTGTENLGAYVVGEDEETVAWKCLHLLRAIGYVFRAVRTFTLWSLENQIMKNAFQQILQLLTPHFNVRCKTSRWVLLLASDLLLWGKRM